MALYSEMRATTMANSKKRVSPSTALPDESLEVWAAKVAAAATPAELELMIGVYRDTANNRRLGQDDRRLARQQAQALRKKQKQNS